MTRFPLINVCVLGVLCPSYTSVQTFLETLQSYQKSMGKGNWTVQNRKMVYKELRKPVSSVQTLTKRSQTFVLTFTFYKNDQEIIFSSRVCTLMDEHNCIPGKHVVVLEWKKTKLSVAEIKTKKIIRKKNVISLDALPDFLLS